MINENSKLKIQKTYKAFVDGKFIRSESGRVFRLKNLNESKDSQDVKNICQCSKKDFRDAVTAARQAQGKWNKSTHYNRGQILYRMAEMLQGKFQQFLEELQWQGISKVKAEKEIQDSIDRLIYYAGWSDKYLSVSSSINPVSNSYFNFSTFEPLGVCAIIAPTQLGLLGLVSMMAPVIVGGNTCVILASEAEPLGALVLTEVLATSDLPAGVVNILTGFKNELAQAFSSHMDVNTIILDEPLENIFTEASENLKKVINYSNVQWQDLTEGQGLSFILDTQEVKTVWQTVGY